MSRTGGLRHGDGDYETEHYSYSMIHVMMYVVSHYIMVHCINVIVQYIVWQPPKRKSLTESNP